MKNKQKLLSKLLRLEENRARLNIRLDNAYLELRDIERKRKDNSRQIQVVIEKLNALDVNS